MWSFDRFSENSLTSVRCGGTGGLATSAAMAGASEHSIMNQTGHRSVNTVRRYIKDGSLFKKNAVVVIGL